MTLNPYMPPQVECSPNQHPSSGQYLDFDPAAVARQVRLLNTWSFVFGIPGLILQATGNMMYGTTGRGVGLLVLLVGTALLIVGLGFYARSRGQSGVYGLLGLLSCIGLVILAVLPRKCLVCSGPVKKKKCQHCGAPGAQ